MTLTRKEILKPALISAQRLLKVGRKHCAILENINK